MPHSPLKNNTYKTLLPIEIQRISFYRIPIMIKKLFAFGVPALLLTIIGGGVAYLATAKPPVQTTVVTKTVPNDQFLR